MITSWFVNDTDILTMFSQTRYIINILLDFHTRNWLYDEQYVGYTSCLNFKTGNSQGRPTKTVLNMAMLNRQALDIAGSKQCPKGKI